MESSIVEPTATAATAWMAEAMVTVLAANAASAQRSNTQHINGEGGERGLEYAGECAVKDISRHTSGSCRIDLRVECSKASLMIVMRSAAPVCPTAGRTLISLTCDAATHFAQTGMSAP